MANKRYEDNNGKNGTSPRAKSSIAQRLAVGAQGQQPDWGRINADLLWRLIQKCTEDDGAVMFGYSRDGGSYSVKVYSDGDPDKIYCHSDAELVDLLTYLLEE